MGNDGEMSAAIRKLEDIGNADDPEGTLKAINMGLRNYDFGVNHAEDLPVLRIVTSATDVPSKVLDPKFANMDGTYMNVYGHVKKQKDFTVCTEGDEVPFVQTLPTIADLVKSAIETDAQLIFLTVNEIDPAVTTKWWEDITRELVEEGVDTRYTTGSLDNMGRLLVDEVKKAACSKKPTVTPVTTTGIVDSETTTDTLVITEEEVPTTMKPSVSEDSSHHEHSHDSSDDTSHEDTSHDDISHDDSSRRDLSLLFDILSIKTIEHDSPESNDSENVTHPSETTKDILLLPTDPMPERPVPDVATTEEVVTTTTEKEVPTTTRTEVVTSDEVVTTTTEKEVPTTTRTEGVVTTTTEKEVPTTTTTEGVVTTTTEIHHGEIVTRPSETTTEKEETASTNAEITKITLTTEDGTEEPEIVNPQKDCCDDKRFTYNGLRCDALIFSCTEPIVQKHCPDTCQFSAWRNGKPMPAFGFNEISDAHCHDYCPKPTEFPPTKRPTQPTEEPDCNQGGNCGCNNCGCNNCGCGGGCGCNGGCDDLSE